MKTFKFLLYSIAVSACLWFSGCATSPKGVSSRMDIMDLCQKYSIHCHHDEVSQVVTLTKGRTQALALIGSNSVILGSQEIFLTKPLSWEKKRIYVPIDFQNKVVDVLLGKEISSRVHSFAVVVDAGHGGKDPGAIGLSGTKEKQVNLDISKEVRDILTARGIRVIMTRDSDEFVTLERRTEIASMSKVDLFVSIHANSSPSRKINGVEVWYSRNLTSVDHKEDQKLKNKDIMFNMMQITPKDIYVRNIISDLLYSYKQDESRKFASDLSQGLAYALRTKTRGTKSSGFFVLRNTLSPAVLIEVGFLSHPQEEKMLQKSSYRKQAAAHIADYILRYASQ